MYSNGHLLKLKFFPCRQIMITIADRGDLGNCLWVWEGSPLVEVDGHAEGIASRLYLVTLHSKQKRTGNLDNYTLKNLTFLQSESHTCWHEGLKLQVHLIEELPEYCLRRVARIWRTNFNNVIPSKMDLGIFICCLLSNNSDLVSLSSSVSSSSKSVVKNPVSSL